MLLASLLLMVSFWILLSFETIQNQILPKMKSGEDICQRVEKDGNITYEQRTSHQCPRISKPIKILSWTPLFHWKDNWYPEGTDAFEKCGFGPEVQCSYTSNKSHLLDSDAILFKIRQVVNASYLPSKRLPQQKWIFYEIEPPTKTWSYVPDLDPYSVQNAFNVTSTYSTDSDVPSHFTIKCKHNHTKYIALRQRNLASGKTKGAVWFVSHCDTPSKREEYVKLLSKHLTVDIFGKCGTLKCGAPPYNKKVSHEVSSECDNKYLNGTYRFYLALENSFCEGYVTEKLTRLIQEKINIIPVVMGYNHYIDLLPRGSFIDVKDYSNPGALASHLKQIAADDEAYSRHARSLLSLDCEAPHNMPYECRLCEYLHKHRGQEQTVDVTKYWSTENKCLTPKQYYKGTAEALT